MSVQVVSCTLQDLFETNNKAIDGTDIKGQLTIPEYQRPYVWKEKQINGLLKDFAEYSKEDKSKPYYYLGSIILHQDNNMLKIIDGQQRLTTMLLLCKFKYPKIKSGIKYSASKSIENIKYNLSYLRDVFEGDVFDFTKIKNSILESIDLQKINVTLVVTTTEDLAYTFFETQNTGGVRLSGSDILKAHHLRAIHNKKLVDYQARKWETINSYEIEEIVHNLTKIRFWDNRKWRKFPFYRDERGIKSVLIEEYTIMTKKDSSDISFYYSAVKKERNQLFQMQESHLKQVKQPLSDGNNTLDYISEYVSLHQILFKKGKTDYRIDDRFYNFRDQVLHGNNGTLFLRELLEIAIISYVSRFGFYKIYEATLWLFRMIYSQRVSLGRNVREDSVFKFVYDYQFIDNILEVYTPEELFQFLERFRYEFDTDNTEEHQSKGKHISTLRTYFEKIQPISEYKKVPKDFDKNLIQSIVSKLEDNYGE
ncbi:DUF262 domain-containing protein [Elizabethkingia miricola]|uniref:DUF262 domain-containing protein n=1 Tax=Elizabethkingia miricola TaxID=172045 RepID=UPI003891AE85